MMLANTLKFHFVFFAQLTSGIYVDVYYNLSCISNNNQTNHSKNKII